MINEKIQQDLAKAVKEIAGFMNLECEVEVKEEPNASGTTLLVSVHTPADARFLIGKNGQNLKALEHMVRLVAARNSAGQAFGVTVDVNDYKKGLAIQAIELAKQVVDRVRNNQKAEALEPMTAYERRVVHMELASYPDIATESIGEEPQRRIVIKPFP